MAHDESRGAAEVAWATSADGVRLAYRVIGRGRPAVLAPAMSWIGEDLAPLAQRRAIALYDIRGQGRSDRVGDDQISLERDVADLEAVRQALALDSAAVLGWSYYGAVAARYAATYRSRVTRLALVAPLAPRAAPHWRAYLDAFAKRLDMARLSALEAQRRAGLPERDPCAWCRAHVELILRVYVADPGCLARMRSSPCVAPNLDPERVNKQTLRVIEAMGDYDWRREMTTLSIPTLLLHGDRDPVPLAGSVEWAEALPDARLDVLEGSGHLPWLEQPDAFFPRLEAFLAEAAAASPPRPSPPRPAP